MWRFSVARKIYLIIGLSFGAGIALTAFLIVRQAQLSEAYSGIVARELASRRLAMSTQVRFKTQVSEWKNILIRGSNAEALERHTQGFRHASASVAATIDSLPAVTGDPIALDFAQRFLHAHATLNEGYAAAQTVFATSGGVDFARADSMVKFRDIPPIVLLDSLAQHLSMTSAKMVAAQQAAVKSQRTAVVVATLVLFLCVAALTVVLVRRMTAPLTALAVAANGIARGELDQSVAYQGDDEIGELAESFRQSIAYLREASMVATRIGAGDLESTVRPRSERDELANTFASLHTTLHALIHETTVVSQAGREGRLQVRGDAKRFEGGFRILIEGLNGTLDAAAKPIHEANVVLERLAARDLTVRMRGNYQGDHARMQSALNGAVQALDTALTDVAAATGLVTSASSEIASVSAGLARGSSDQASSLEEVSGSLVEMASMASQASTSAQQMRSLTEETRTVTASGVADMRRLMTAMEGIKTSSNSTARILKTIDEIAFQTNLLALNAAVEAARAGDAGRGFAVVAEEVRALALRSAEAAKQTGALIDNNVRSAEEGAALSGQVSMHLEEIDRRVNKVRAVVSEIAAASEQQSKGIAQINDATGQMSQVTQQVAADAEEAAALAEELTGQAAGTRELVEAFHLTINSRSQSAEVDDELPTPRPAAGHRTRRVMSRA